MLAVGRRLLPVLSWGFGVAVIVGGTIGVGILRTPGTVASLVRDPTLIAVVWVLGGVYALLCANYTAELATMSPDAGGPLVYARRAFGNLVGGVVGLCDWILNTAAIAFLGIALADFGARLFDEPPVGTSVGAAIAIAALALVNAAGVRTSDQVQRLTSGAKGLILLAVVAACFLTGADAPSASVASPPVARWRTVPDVALALQIVVAAYGGWNSAAYFAEEVRTVSRDVPRALFGGVIAVCALYVATNVALWRLLPVPATGAPTVAMEDALRATFGAEAARLVAVLALVTLPSVMNAGLLCGSRILLALGRAGAMPWRTTAVESSGSPVVAIGATALCSIVLVVTGTFDTLLRFYAVLAVAMNVCLVCGLFVLRRREGGAARPFLTLGYPVAPIVLLAADVALLVVFVASDPWSGVGALGCIAASAVTCVVARRTLVRERVGVAPLRTAA